MLLFAGRFRLDREGVNPIGEEIGKRLVDRALAGDAVEARKGRRFDLHGEVALATRIVAGMAAVEFAVVAHDEMRRSEGLLEPARDFGRHRPGYLTGHRAYIWGLVREREAVGERG